MKAGSTSLHLPFRLRRFVCTVMLASIVCLTLSVSTCRAQGAPEREALAHRFQVALPAADVAVLFDASLSMRAHRYDAVRQAVIDFVPALNNKELLHLRVFGDVAGAPLEGPADKLAGNVAVHLPTAPLFHNTDLGAAISKAVEFFERPGASEVQALFLLTDGLHQPPTGSPYTRDFANDPSWQSLRRRAQALCERRQVLVYGFGLGEQTDIALLLRLFPAANVEVITGAAAQVAATLQRVRETLRLNQLRQVIGQDLRTGGIEARFAPDAARGDAGGVAPAVTIRNSYQHLPVVIDNIKMQMDAATGEEIICALEAMPRDLALAPKGEWQGQLRCGLRNRLPQWRIGRSAHTYRAILQLSPAARFLHEAELGRLNVEPAAPRIDAPALSVELRARYGVPYWLITVSLLAVSSLVWLRRRRSKNIAHRQALTEQRQTERTRLAGTLKIWPARQDEPHDEGADLGLHKTQQLELMLNAEGALEIVQPAAQAGEVVARLSGRLLGAAPNQADAGKVEYRLEAARGHRLAYEAGGESANTWREAARMTLCDRDLIEIDNRWRLRYANHRLRTRAEVESARNVRQAGELVIGFGQEPIPRISDKLSSLSDIFREPF